MKENKAPEKIYVPTAGDELHYHMTCPNNEFQDSIEYTRTDAFIEKADKFISTFFHPDDTELKKSILDEFHKYMKGE